MRNGSAIYGRNPTLRLNFDAFVKKAISGIAYYPSSLRRMSLCTSGLMRLAYGTFYEAVPY